MEQEIREIERCALHLEIQHAALKRKHIEQWVKSGKKMYCVRTVMALENLRKLIFDVQMLAVNLQMIDEDSSYNPPDESNKPSE